jgi:hypothetical protein
MAHYEIEQAGLGREPDPVIGTPARPKRWHKVNVLTANAVPTPLTFEALTQALDYVRRTSGTLRVVEVSDEGERVPMDASTP